MSENQTLEERIAKLEARNRRVEADKAWEISWFRRLLIVVLIYITVVLYLQYVVHTSPWIDALVSVIAYGLSTLTVSTLKTQWLKRRKTK